MAVDSTPIEGSIFADSYNSFYPLTIPVSHWQLRHYISHPQQNVLYYASGRDIFYLNTQTRTQKRIATIPFEARCTASGHGYVCVGGANQGHFAAIKLTTDRGTVHVDDPLPLDYNFETPLPTDPDGTPQVSSIEVNTIGDQIINSISIHQICDHDAHLYDLVVVLTNNDNTVRVYSLTQRRETTRLDMPFAMNHASLSPDGKTLAAVGDSNCVFLFDRILLDEPPLVPKPFNRLNTSSVTWRRLTALKLHIPDPADASHRGYFTTAWSQSGHLLAIGSEAGYISIIDMVMLRQLRIRDREEAIVGVVRSSRPHNPAYMCPGAVRCMVFSPDPWDLLIWAEDRGRLCIADLRTGLHTRQVIELDTRKQDLERHEIAYIDNDDEMPDLEPATSTARDGRETTITGRADPEEGEYDGSPASYLGIRRATGQPVGLSTHFPNASTMRLREDTLFHDDPRGLTAHEQQVLEALRTSRQRQEALAQGESPSTNYTTAADVSTLSEAVRQRRANNDSSTTLADADSSFPSLTRVRAVSNTRASELAGWSRGELPDNPSPTRSSPRMRGGRIWPAADERTRSTRRQLGLISFPGDTLQDGPSDSSSSEEAAGQDDDSAWQRISNAMSIARGSFVGGEHIPEDPSAEDQLALLARQRERLLQIRPSLMMNDAEEGSGGSTERYELLREATSAIRGLRDMSRSRMDGHSAVARAGTSRSAPRREYGVRTAGLAISQDGRTVWAATEEGIFEIKLDIKRRLMWSAIDMA